VYTYNAQTSFGSFITAFDPGQADSRGALVYDLSTQPDDPEGEYYVTSDVVHRFWFERVFGLWKTPPPPLLVPPFERGPQAMMAFTSIGEANHVWASVIDQNGRREGDLATFYAGGWLAEVQGVLRRLRSSGSYRQAQLTGLQLNSARVLPDGRLEALVTETWDDRQFSAGGSPERDLSGTLDQRYVFARAGDSWVIVESEIVRH
jgi:hypothetical protein